MRVQNSGKWGAAFLAVLAALACIPSGASAALGWSAPLARDTAGNGPALTALACASDTACAALDQNGGEVTFPAAAPTPSAAAAVLPSTPIDATCPAVNRCVAIDVSGNEVTFEPGAPAAAKASAVDPGKVTVSLSCVSISRCVAVDTSGNAVTFDPASPGGAAVRKIDSSGLSAVSCPGTSPALENHALCMAIDTGGNAVGFDGTTGTPNSPNPQPIESSSSSAPQLTTIVCPSTSQCVAFDNAGGEFTLNPTPGTSGLTSSKIDSGHSIIAAFCVSTTQCVALDDVGQELTFVPGVSGLATPGLVINPAKTNLALACVSPTRCLASDKTGHVIGFNPGNGSVSGISLVDGGGSYAAVACALPSQCTAADQDGDAVTFNPASGATVAAANVDPARVTLFSIACPSATQCTAVDENGQEVTFNPQTPTTATPVALVRNHPLLASSCASSTQCTAVDDDQYAVTFNPQAPSSRIYTLLGTPPGAALTGLACPSLTQCTAVDGAGDEVTFNPHSLRHPPPFALLPDGAIDVSCPTATECVAVGSGGERSTFAPGTPQTATTGPIDLVQPIALSCPVATRCVAADAANHGVEFDPGGNGVAALSAPPTRGSLTSLACTSAGACVSVDSSGVAFSGGAQVPAPPGAAGAPRITGRFLEGQRLTVSGGRWTNAPTSLYLRWERCSATGTGCSDIAGATHPSYTASAADAGHTLKVRETAANAGGFGATQLSPGTALIAGLPGPPVLVRPALTGARGSHPKLALDLRASRWGPAVRSVTVTLPSGTSLTLPSRHGPVFRTLAGLEITAGGKSVSHSEWRVPGGLTISLARPASKLHIAISRPLLSIAAPLAHAVATHRTRTLAFHLRVLGADGRAWTVRGSLRAS